MDDHHKEDEKGPETAAEELGVQPRVWQRARPVARIKPQYSAAEVARRYLDDMESGGRLHHLNRKDD